MILLDYYGWDENVPPRSFMTSLPGSAHRMSEHNIFFLESFLLSDDVLNKFGPFLTHHIVFLEAHLYCNQF